MREKFEREVEEKPVERLTGRSMTKVTTVKSVRQVFRKKLESPKHFETKTSTSVKHCGENVKEKDVKKYKNNIKTEANLVKKIQLQEKVNIWDDYFKKKSENVIKGGQNEYLEEKKKVGQKAENDPSKETNQTTKNSEKLKGSKFARPKRADKR